MKGNFNYIARYYDSLSRIVFGDAIVTSQRYLIQFIKPNSNILIVGGGTGWILEEIAKKHFDSLHITYVEMSQKMIELSKRRNVGRNKIVFINQAIQSADLNASFDVIITPFLLDNFSNETTTTVFKKIDEQLVGGGSWLYGDFQLPEDHAFWQRFLITLMYTFFKLMCGIEANKLPETDSLFQQGNYQKSSSKTFFHDMICSIHYQKPL